MTFDPVTLDSVRLERVNIYVSMDRPINQYLLTSRNLQIDTR